MLARRSKITPVLIVLLCVAAGCRRPPEPFARGGGSLNLDTLARHHPAWSQVEALEAKIRRLQTVPPATPLPPVPDARALQSTGSDEAQTPNGIAPEERREIERLTRERVEGDYQALLTQLEREVERFETVQRAGAMARADVALDARRERFAAEYAAVARRYADPLGERTLRLLALKPAAGDVAFYTVEERQRRDAERARVQVEIESLRARRQAELDSLRTGYEADVAALRTEAESAAREASRRYEAQRRAQLRESRDRQQVRAQEDLERALTGDPASTLPVRGGALSDPRAEEATEAIRQRVARSGAEIPRVGKGVSDSHASARRQLEGERDRLRTMIRESTQALALAIAAEERLKIRFERTSPDPVLTEQMLSLLKQHWQTAVAPTPGARSSATAAPEGARLVAVEQAGG